MRFYCYLRRLLSITSLENRIRLLSQIFEGKIIFSLFATFLILVKLKIVKKLDLKTAIKIHRIISALSLFPFNNEVGLSLWIVDRIMAIKKTLSSLNTFLKRIFMFIAVFHMLELNFLKSYALL